MRRPVLFFLWSLISITVFSQQWQELLIKGERNFSKIRDAFYEEWDGKTIDRGSGYKLFKRWEHRMLPRLVDGKYLPNIASSYFIKLKEEQAISSIRTQSEIETWTSLGPTSWQNGPNGYNPGIGRVNSVDIHPTDPNTLFVGTAGGGLWKSTDAGQNWTPVYDDLAVLGVSDFYIDPTNPDIMYLLTGDAYGADTYSVGMLVSTNAGVTWTESGLDLDVTIGYRLYRMIVDPTNRNNILIAGNGGLFRSDDGGATWVTEINEVVTDVEFKPGNPSVVYASTYGGAFYRSVNGGDSWSLIRTSSGALGRTALGVSQEDPAYVYMLSSASNSLFGGVYKSTDSGQSISLQSSSPNIFGYSLTADDGRGQGNYDLAIAVNPQDAEDIYVSGIHIWNSKDGGQTWQDESDNYQVLNYWVYNSSNTSKYVHADNHTLDFLNGNLYAGSDGGIWRSSNLGSSWVDLSETLNNTQFYRLGQDPNDEDRIVAGAQDNGSNLLTEEGWIHLYGADGMEALIDHENGNTVYSTYQFGGIIKYSGTSAVANITSNLMDTEGVSGGWITPYTLDPDDSDIIYLGLEDIWKSENQGANGSWTRISDFQSSSTQLHLAVSAVDNDYIYTTTGWSLRRSKNGGASWESINAGLPSEYNTYLTISEEDPETIWATFSGYSAGEKVYMSTNAGDTWTNVSDGLPNIPTNCIVHLRGTEDQVFAGTDIGVYQKEGDSDWQPWFEGLPNVEVTELEIHYQAGKVRAATYGRGLWERPIGNRLVLNSISGTKEEILEGESIDFSSDYEGVPESILWTFDGGTPNTSTEENPTVVYSTPGIYDVKFQIFGINTPAIVLEDYVTVFDKVEVTSLFVSAQEIHLGENVVFKVNHDGDVEEYSWTFDGGTPATSTEKFPRVTYSQKGSFDVSVEISGVNTGSKTFEDFITVLPPLGIDDSKESLSISPNVSSGVVVIDLERDDFALEIIDSDGKQIFSRSLNNQNEEILDISFLKSGLYFLKVRGKTSDRVGRVIRE